MKLSRLIYPLVVAALALGAPTRAWAQHADDKATSTDPSPDKLVSDLGADDYQKREEAQKKLVALGRKALPALQAAERDSKDAEVRARAHEAIASINKDHADAAPEREKKGELEPDQPKVEGDGDEDQEPRGIRPPRLNDLFRGGRDMDGDMPEAFKKMIQQIQKQFEGMDKQFQRELSPPGNRGGMRVQVVGRPRTAVELKLGVSLVPPPPVLAAQLNLLPADGSLVVDELTPGQPAWKVGLQRYDVVLTLDGKPVRTPGDLAGLGERDAKVEVMRKAQRVVVLVHKIADSEPTPGGAEKKGSEGDAPQAKPEEPARKF